MPFSRYATLSVFRCFAAHDGWNSSRKRDRRKPVDKSPENAAAFRMTSTWTVRIQFYIYKTPAIIDIRINGRIKEKIFIVKSWNREKILNSKLRRSLGQFMRDRLNYFNQYFLYRTYFMSVVMLNVFFRVIKRKCWDYRALVTKFLSSFTRQRKANSASSDGAWGQLRKKCPPTHEEMTNILTRLGRRTTSGFVYGTFSLTWSTLFLSLRRR